jgi:hypothetical protein
MEKWERRAKKRHKARHGMKVRGRSVFVIAEQDGVTKKSRKGRKAKRK